MAEELTDILEGQFTRIIFRSDNYMVSKFETSDGSLTVTGPSFDFVPDQKYILTGNYVEHPKYGFQFNMTKIEKSLPAKKDEIINFLKSKTFPGIGKRCAEKIYKAFGDDTLKILKENSSLLLDLDLTDKQLASLQSGFENLNDPQNEIIFELVSNGFSSLDAQKIFNRFKLVTFEIAKDNPFKFYNECYGISFDKVKNYAKTLDFSDSENKYKEAFIIHTLREMSFNSGDIFINEEDLLNTLAFYGSIDNYEEIIEMAIVNQYIHKEDNHIYLYEDYCDELFISNFLKNMSNELVLEDELIEEGISNIQNDLNIKYDVKQIDAISNFFKNSVSFIVGGPGTGKTTIVNAMVNMFKQYFPYQNLIVVAPTGRAAKRINEICEVETKTIHSLLRWNKETNTFICNEDNPIMYDAIIIDEFSMVDNSLFASLLKASKRVMKICIIGDHNQLPSIRPGYVLNDLIESERFVTTYLTANYRQSNGSEILSLSEDIINDDVDLSKYKKDIRFLDIKKDKFDIVKLIEKDIIDGYSLDEIQILAPMYKGEYGIDNLNNLLQSTFNPKDKEKVEKQVGSLIFREHDKILQLKNRPTDDVYNGDIGILEEIDLTQKCFLINYQNTYVLYNYDELSDISLAYALSVHKSQGSEYQVVYFIISRSNMYMLNKKLIYTAISRAKAKLIIIGEESVFLDGLKHMMKARKTTLKKRLES